MSIKNGRIDGIHFWIPAVVIWVLAAYGLVSIIRDIA